MSLSDEAAFRSALAVLCMVLAIWLAALVGVFGLVVQVVAWMASLLLYGYAQHASYEKGPEEEIRGPAPEAKE